MKCSHVWSASAVLCCGESQIYFFYFFCVRSCSSMVEQQNKKNTNFFSNDVYNYSKMIKQLREESKLYTQNINTREWIQGWSVMLDADFICTQKIGKRNTNKPREKKPNRVVQKRTEYHSYFSFWYYYFLQTATITIYTLKLSFFAASAFDAMRWYCDESFEHYLFTRLTYVERCTTQRKRPIMNKINREMKKKMILVWHYVVIRSRLSNRLCLNKLWIRAVRERRRRRRRRWARNSWVGNTVKRQSFSWFRFSSNFGHLKRENRLILFFD